MSQRLPASNSDRVSPRRRFHRPAAEFLGARRQVPVLTGLPSVEPKPAADPEKQQPDLVEETSHQPEFEQTPDVVEQAMETVVEDVEDKVDIREVLPSGQAIENPWRGWAYPVAGTLIASLLVYTAWSGLNNSRQTPQEPTRPTEATFHAAVETVPVVVTPPQVAAVPPSRVVSSEPAPLMAPAPLTAPAPTMEPAPITEPMTEPAHTTETVTAEPVERTPMAEDLAVEALPAQRPLAAQPFVEAPIVFADPPRPTEMRSPEFVEHDVLHWEESTPEIATKPDVPSPPPTDSASSPLERNTVLVVEHDPFQATSREAVLSEQSPEARTVESTEMESAETRAPEIPFVAAGPADDFQEDLTLGEPTEADYPTTDFADELPPAPQAAVEKSQPLGNPQDFAAAPSLQPATPAVQTNTEPAPMLPTTPSNQFIGYPVANPQAAVAASPAGTYPATSPMVNSQGGHVIVNPHFQPVIRQPANEQPTYETASVLPGPALGNKPAFDPAHCTLSRTTSNTNSIYGSFPVLNAPAKPSIDQVRLNGSIEPFPQTKR